VLPEGALDRLYGNGHVHTGASAFTVGSPSDKVIAQGDGGQALAVKARAAAGTAVLSGIAYQWFRLPAEPADALAPAGGIPVDGATAAELPGSVLAGLEEGQHWFYAIAGADADGVPVQAGSRAIKVTVTDGTALGMAVDVGAAGAPVGPGWHYDAQSSTFTVLDGADVAFTGTTGTNRIAVAEGARAKVTLHNVAIDLSSRERLAAL
jgi:hypothetical protein